jgi:hypothetical protein
MKAALVSLPLKIERKQAGLPRYVVVPSGAIAAWELTATTVLRVSLAGAPADRRTIKRWDEARWFLTITGADCTKHGLDTGDTVTVAMQPAGDRMPKELTALIAVNRSARAAWERLTPARQRMLREEIGDAGAACPASARRALSSTSSERSPPAASAPRTSSRGRAVPRAGCRAGTSPRSARNRRRFPSTSPRSSG